MNFEFSSWRLFFCNYDELKVYNSRAEEFRGLKYLIYLDWLISSNVPILSFEISLFTKFFTFNADFGVGDYWDFYFFYFSDFY